MISRQASAIRHQTINQFAYSILTKPNLQIQINENCQELLQNFQYDYFQRKIAFTTLDGTIYIYEIIKNRDIYDKKLISTFKAHNGKINSIAWQTPQFEGKLATCSTQDKKVYCWKDEGNEWTNINMIIPCNNRIPTKLLWINDQLIVGYQNGEISINETQNILNDNDFTNLYDLDTIQINEQQNIIGVIGNDDDNATLLKLYIYKLSKPNQIIYLEQFHILEDTKSIKFGPYLFENKLKLALLRVNIVQIITIEYEIQFDNINFQINKAFDIHLDYNCEKIEWSILGNELSIYGNNNLQVYQQTFNDEYELL